ncbi:aldehyde-activating protein [Notoacmeibacter marinus]|uniref:Aldehyde-activating protein n=1 Tax=Notoacmeibacter marinus TaxID=1876515 RepID=A0A231UX20_9HYPH|nr:GFA family protein [Notoacmeibacter marinus]OXT00503.1 aldehyde-activating protein [Notoacmeibacter marinus]
MPTDQQEPTWPLKGGCHCGSVRFEVRLKGGFEQARRCNCSYCAMRGAVALTANMDDFAIVKGREALTLYTFNTRATQHYFCSCCGIYTHHRRRSHPGEYGINAACLDGVGPFDFETLPVYDGQHHTKDGGSDGIVGMLRLDKN